MLQTSYLHQLFDFDKTKILVRAFRKAKKIAKFDAIVVTGVSGVGLGSVVSHATKTPMLIIRKKQDNSHSSFKKEGCFNSGWNYCFFDDMVSSGSTFDYVAEHVGEKNIKSVFLFRCGSYLNTFRQEHIQHSFFIDYFGKQLCYWDDKISKIEKMVSL